MKPPPCRSLALLSRGSGRAPLKLQPEVWCSEILTRPFLPPPSGSLAMTRRFTDHTENWRPLRRRLSGRLPHGRLRLCCQGRQRANGASVNVRRSSPQKVRAKRQNENITGPRAPLTSNDICNVDKTFDWGRLALPPSAPRRLTSQCLWACSAMCASH